MKRLFWLCLGLSIVMSSYAFGQWIKWLEYNAFLDGKPGYVVVGSLIAIEPLISESPSNPQSMNVNLTFILQDDPSLKTPKYRISPVDKVQIVVEYRQDREQCSIEFVRGKTYKLGLVLSEDGPPYRLHLASCKSIEVHPWSV